MTTFHVDSAAVASAATAARSTIVRIQSDVASLHAHLTGLGASWSGPAATAFQDVVARWRATQNRIESELTSVNEALSIAARQYADMEMAHLRMFQ